MSDRVASGVELKRLSRHFRLQRYIFLGFITRFIQKSLKQPVNLCIYQVSRRAGTYAYESMLVDCWRDVLSKNGEYINQRGRMS